MKKRDDTKYEAQRLKWEAIQEKLKKEMVTKDTFAEDDMKYIGGVDLSFGDNDMAVAALVVLTFSDLKVVYEDYSVVKLTLPYICGFLAFREVDPLVELIEKLRNTKPGLLPSVILVDGSGEMHPRQFGLACHLGVLSKIATIGVSKKLLAVDGWTREDINDKKEKELVKFGDIIKVIGKTNKKYYGVALRGKSKNPIFVSCGHNVSLPTSIEIVKKCCLYRIPEPIRQADLRSREVIRRRKREKEEKK